MNILKLSILTFSVLLSSNALSQENNEETVKILCSNKIDKREIAYDKGREAWCDTTVDAFCAFTKREAIRKVCNKTYGYKLERMKLYEKRGAAAENAPKAVQPEVAQPEKKVEQVSSLEQERMNIELKKLEIEQRKLDLRKKKLDLLKDD